MPSNENYIYNNLPFIGTPYLIKEDDPPNRKPLQVTRAKVGVFDLSKPEDLKALEKVWDDSTRGWNLIGAEERVYDNDTKNWRVFMRWIEQYYTNPTPEGPANVITKASPA